MARYTYPVSNRFVEVEVVNSGDRVVLNVSDSGSVSQAVLTVQEAVEVMAGLASAVQVAMVHVADRQRVVPMETLSAPADAWAQDSQV